MGQDTEAMTTTPDDIEATRANLSRDIDELTDKVSPARVVERRKEAVRGRWSSVKDKVMGSAGHASSSAGSAVPKPGDVTGAVSDKASGALDTVGAKAQGNPLAAGVVAFGAGMLISALIPASEPEARIASRAVDAAKEHGQPLVDEATSVGQQMGQDLKQSATESVQQVKSTAQDSAQTVAEEGKSSAQTVKDDARPNG